MEKKRLLTAAFISALLFSAVAETMPVKLASANFLPPVDATITIDSPQNAIFTGDSIVLNFTGQSNWDIYSYYYSVDGQSLKTAENIKIILQEEPNSGNPSPTKRTTVQGSCTLHNLSEGWHNVTIYNIATEDFDYNIPHYQKGDTMYKIAYSFRIQGESLSIALISVAIVATISVGLLVFFKKRKQQQAETDGS